eukprot:TRINITY_DN18494_c0_g1_i2.p1 TRINITY_DN18494_c0_g1~~TRINITY_DN18494_c0_g1_i2.p1  ORF type:complete len:148 (+),score=36.23 TRINITY_DN18494_c0_g1_i2:27-470(+)
MGARLGCPARSRTTGEVPAPAPGQEAKDSKSATTNPSKLGDPSQPLSRTDREAAAELRRLERTPLDEQDQKLLRKAAGLPGRFEGNAFVVDPAAKGDADSEVVTGTVVLYNASKGYGVVRATASGTEAFFSKDGLADDVVGVKEGDA